MRGFRKKGAWAAQMIKGDNKTPALTTRGKWGMIEHNLEAGRLSIQKNFGERLSGERNRR